MDSWSDGGVFRRQLHIQKMKLNVQGLTTLLKLKLPLANPFFSEGGGAERESNGTGGSLSVTKINPYSITLKLSH